jgi:hypothetical protein
VAGCAKNDVPALKAQIEALGYRVYEETNAPALLADLRTLWAKPCLAHLARVVPPPSAATLDSLRDAWDRGFGATLADAAGGLRTMDGHRVLVIPPEVLPELTEAERAEVAPVLCTNGAVDCARSMSYVARADNTFGGVEALTRAGQSSVWAPHWSRSLLDVPVCTNKEVARAPPGATTFEAWAVCAAALAPQAWKYADVRFRAPDRGWLVLRGRRGHYSGADEIRAYDLATGAAYVARQQWGLSVPPSVPRDRPELITGRLAPDQVRELAFVLLTKGAILRVRRNGTLMAVPEDIALKLSALPRADLGSGPRFSISSSDQTTLDFAYIVDGSVVRQGHFTWPSSDDAREAHIDDLVRVVEAGLIPGCAPAKLPARLGGEAWHPVINDYTKELMEKVNKLQAKLEGLRGMACPGAR